MPTLPSRANSLSSILSHGFHCLRLHRTTCGKSSNAELSRSLAASYRSIYGKDNLWATATININGMAKGCQASLAHWRWSLPAQISGVGATWRLHKSQTKMESWLICTAWRENYPNPYHSSSWLQRLGFLFQTLCRIHDQLFLLEELDWWFRSTRMDAKVCNNDMWQKIMG